MIDEATLIAADRWRLWCSLTRGLGHQLANASQMLTLEPVPATALGEARERMAYAIESLGAFRGADASGPQLLPAVLRSLDRLQRMQMEFPATPMPVALGPNLPAIAGAPEDLAHLLLGMVTLLKEAVHGQRADLALTATPMEGGVEIVLVERRAPACPLPGRALELLARRMGARLEAGGTEATLRLQLPGWEPRRPQA
ncbi:MAG: hypothetical protein IT348_00655 [Candidatus Eisenbacteria bacterium]|nr:hypothetical protein [Candidatus Eisenbacteria bacterium]